MIAAYYPPLAQESLHTVIECGGELGSLVLSGRTGVATPWEFQTVVTDWSACVLNDDADARRGPGRVESDWVSSWAAAVALLDQKRWELLIPGTVHAEFRTATLAEVTRRLVDHGDERAPQLLGRWASACRAEPLQAARRRNGAPAPIHLSRLSA